MKIVIVGGAGYIGSHMVKALVKEGHEVLAVDNLSTGFRDAVIAGRFYELDIADREKIGAFLLAHQPEAVFHFASFIQVGESINEPAKYYANNVTATLSLLDAMVAAEIPYFIFSSTAAVYGNPQYTPIDENHPKNPINPYGLSKLMVEQILEDYGRAYGLKSVSLRYFNAAGADPEGELGERHEPETHLIPLALQAASGRRDSISIYGNDYQTEDGTCIRDYIHVVDLVDAHSKALDYLKQGKPSAAFNLGNGNGFSVSHLIDVTRRVTQKPIAEHHVERRAGDPPVLVADATQAKNTLGWNPQYTNLDQIIQDAWMWEQKYPWN